MTLYSILRNFFRWNKTKRKLAKPNDSSKTSYKRIRETPQVHEHKPAPSTYDRFAYASGPQVYKVNEFVICRYLDPYGFPTEDFGWIVKFLPPEIYTVRLLTKNEELVNVPNAQIRKAGRA